LIFGLDFLRPIQHKANKKNCLDKKRADLNDQSVPYSHLDLIFLFFRRKWKGVVAKPAQEEQGRREGEVRQAIFNGCHIDEGDDSCGDIKNDFVPG